MSKSEEFFGILLNSDEPEFEQIQKHIESGNFLQARDVLKEFLTPTEQQLDEILDKMRDYEETETS